MMAPFYITVALFCALQLPGDALGVSMRDFQEINEYLMEELRGNDDPEDNMVAANKWLKLNPTDVSESLLVALKLLKSLKEITGGRNCDARAFEVKTALRDAIKGEEGTRRVRMNRIDAIANHFFEQQAIDCASVYPNLYKEKAQQLDKKTIELVDKLFEKTIQMYFSDELDELQTSEGLAKHFLTNYTVFEGRVAYNTITALFEGDVFKSEMVTREEGKIELHPDKVRKLYQNIIVDPCQRYIILLGSDVFELAAFDRPYRHQVERDQVPFQRGWAKYQVCNLVVSAEERWADELVGVAKRIVANLKR